MLVEIQNSYAPNLPVGTERFVKRVKTVPERTSPVKVWMKQEVAADARVTKNRHNRQFVSPGTRQVSDQFHGLLKVKRS